MHKIFSRHLPLLAAAALCASPALANNEPFGPDIGSWSFTQSSNARNQILCRAVYAQQGGEFVFGRWSTGRNWVSLPSQIPAGKVPEATIAVGDKAEPVPGRSDGKRLWLEDFDLSMFDDIARARGYEWAYNDRVRGKVRIDGNGAAAFKRLAECLAVNTAAGLGQQPAKPVAQAAPAAPATRPTSGKTSIIYPDSPGSSQSCVIPVDPDTRRFKVDHMSELMLANASATQCQVFQVSKQRISVAGRPDLCVNISGGARNGSLYLESCKDSAVTQWDAAGTATISARLRAVGGQWDNQCWTIPLLSDVSAKLPIHIRPAECQKNASREMKFFVE